MEKLDAFSALGLYDRLVTVVHKWNSYSRNCLLCPRFHLSFAVRKGLFVCCGLRTLGRHSEHRSKISPGNYWLLTHHPGSRARAPDGTPLDPGPWSDPPNNTTGTTTQHTPKHRTPHRTHHTQNIHTQQRFSSWQWFDVVFFQDDVAAKIMFGVSHISISKKAQHHHS